MGFISLCTHYWPYLVPRRTCQTTIFSCVLQMNSWSCSLSCTSGKAAIIYGNSILLLIVPIKKELPGFCKSDCLTLSLSRVSAILHVSRHVYVADCQKITEVGVKMISPLKHILVLNMADCTRKGCSRSHTFPRSTLVNKV